MAKSSYVASIKLIKKHVKITFISSLKSPWVQIPAIAKPFFCWLFSSLSINKSFRWKSMRPLYQSTSDNHLFNLQIATKDWDRARLIEAADLVLDGNHWYQEQCGIEVERAWIFRAWAEPELYTSSPGRVRSEPEPSNFSSLALVEPELE